MTPITQQQKKEIHTIVSQLKWTRQVYEFWLDHNYGVDSCMDLTTCQADDAIYSLRRIAQESRITDKQISYIKFLWLSVDYSSCTEGNNLLNNFLTRKYGVDCVENLSKKQAFGAIAAIKNIQKNKTTVKLDKQGGVDWVILEDGSRYPTLQNFNIQ